MTASNLGYADRQRPDTLVLFDVDGTLTAARKSVQPDVLEVLEKLRKIAVVGFVGGSDLAKQKEQLGEDVLERFDYGFAENGLVAYRNGKELASQSFIRHIGEERYKDIVNWVLRYIADLDIPIKRGTFVEFRNGMINVSPIGRNCSYQERVEFEKFDQEHNIRKTMVDEMKKFAPAGLTYSIGGQISFDVFPTGWDKTYCLRHVENDGFKEIHFFGDKTHEGGNDYEIYTHPKVKGHSVKNPQDTISILKELFKI